MSPIISVIIPNYNHESFLHKRIESILNQSFQDYELIFLDDKSTDRSRDIMESYRSHPKVSQLLFNKENRGSTFKQWEKGVQLAKGKWIWIAESDDWAHPDFLLKCMECISYNSQAEICFTASQPIDETGETLSVDVLATPFDEFVSNLSEADYCRKGIEIISNGLLYKNILPNASAVVFRKELFESAVKTVPPYKYIADWWVWYQLLKKASICYIATPLNYFRFHQGSTRSTSEKKIASIMERYQLYQEFKTDGYEVPSTLFDKLFYYLLIEMQGLSLSRKWSILQEVHAYDKKVYRRLGHYLLNQLKKR